MSSERDQEEGRALPRDVFQRELASYASTLESSSLEFQGLQEKIARSAEPWPDDCRQLSSLLCTMAVFVQRLSTLLKDSSKLPAETTSLRIFLLMTLQSTEMQIELLFPLVGSLIEQGRTAERREKQQMKYHLSLLQQHYAEMQVQYHAFREKVFHQERQQVWSMLVADMSDEAKQKRKTVSTLFNIIRTSLQSVRFALCRYCVKIDEQEKLQAVIDQMREPIGELKAWVWREAIPWISTRLEDVLYKLMQAYRWLIIALDIQRGWKTALKKAQYFPLKFHYDYYHCLEDAYELCEAALSLFVQQIQPLASLGEPAPGPEEAAQ